MRLQHPSCHPHHSTLIMFYHSILHHCLQFHQRVVCIHQQLYCSLQIHQPTVCIISLHHQSASVYHSLQIIQLMHHQLTHHLVSPEGLIWGLPEFKIILIQGQPVNPVLVFMLWQTMETVQWKVRHLAPVRYQYELQMKIQTGFSWWRIYIQFIDIYYIVAIHSDVCLYHGKITTVRNILIIKTIPTQCFNYFFQVLQIFLTLNLCKGWVIYCCNQIMSKRIWNRREASLILEIHYEMNFPTVSRFLG